MAERTEQIKLLDGTRIRHSVIGYEGQVDGTTEIKACFTAGGKLLDKPSANQKFQYRVAVEGETLRRIAPAEDLEVLEAVVEIVCSHCNSSFKSKPGLIDKPGGRCQCGAWICPSCLACGGAGKETAKGGQRPCPKGQKRIARRLVALKKRKSG